VTPPKPPKKTAVANVVEACKFRYETGGEGATISCAWVLEQLGELEPSGPPYRIHRDA
jgi:hypothetical protein